MRPVRPLSDLWISGCPVLATARAGILIFFPQTGSTHQIEEKSLGASTDALRDTPVIRDW
jgi:hypothetical protein